MSDHNAKKITIIALLLSFMAIGISESITTTTVGVQWVVNNTNLAPFVAGHGGTGERVGDNTTYWNNATPIQIFLYSHANTSGTAAEIHLWINGTKVSDTSGRALGIAEQSNRSIVATIPQYSFYSVEMVNYHHYEWYEYKILTGNFASNASAIDHNNLSDLQGGYAPFNEFYHLNKTHYDIVESMGVDCSGLPTFYWVLGFDSGTNSVTCDAIPVDNLSWQTTKVNKSGDNITGALITKNITMDNYLNITTSNTNFDPKMCIDIGCFGSAKSSGFPFMFFSLNAYFNNGAWVIPNSSDRSLLFLLGSSAAGYSNSFVIYQTITAGGTDFTPLFGSDGKTSIGKMEIGGYSPTESLSIKNISVSGNYTGGRIRADSLQGTGVVYVCVNATGVLYRGNPGC